MHRPMAVSVLLCALSLTACANSQPPIIKTEIIREQVPAALTTCADRPVPPTDPVTDQKIGRWIVDLILAHEDCHGKNARIRQLQEENHEKTD